MIKINKKPGDIIKIKHILNQRTIGNKGAKAARVLLSQTIKRMTAEELIESFMKIVSLNINLFITTLNLLKTNLLIVNEIFNVIMMNKSFQNILEQENLSELPSQILNPINKEASK